MIKSLTNYMLLALACALPFTACQTPSGIERQTRRDYLKLTIEESGTKKDPIFSILNAQLLRNTQIENRRVGRNYIETRNERGETLDKVPLYPQGYSSQINEFIAENFSGQGRIIPFRSGTFEANVPYNPGVSHFHISSQNTKTNIPAVNIER